MTEPMTPPSVDPAVASGVNQDEKNMGMLLYVLGIITGFIGPVILWLMKKDTMPFVNDQGKEVLNFQITVFLCAIVCGILMMVVIGIFLLPLVMLAYLILMIMGALKAKEGIAYRFPFALRLLK
jgi:uncharacterized protein